jgi:hypothetical protein
MAMTLPVKPRIITTAGLPGTLPAIAPGMAAKASRAVRALKLQILLGQGLDRGGCFARVSVVRTFGASGGVN